MQQVNIINLTQLYNSKKNAKNPGTFDKKSDFSVWEKDTDSITSQAIYLSLAVPKRKSELIKISLSTSQDETK